MHTAQPGMGRGTCKIVEVPVRQSTIHKPLLIERPAILSAMDKEQELSIWGQAVPASLIKEHERAYLSQLNSIEPPPVEQIWREMDKAWDGLGLSAIAKPGAQQLAEFYCHPVWILNGLFSAIDPQSCAHREAIAKAIHNLEVRSIADYGGGMGELAIRISRNNPNDEISIIEPYPSEIGRHRVAQYANISYVPSLQGPYDLVIAQDVLEHLEDPVGLVAQLSNATRLGGYLIFANCFYPVVKCHLPSTFHLRDTFNWVVQGAGLEFIGSVQGAEHASIFRKKAMVHVASLRGRELYSKARSAAKRQAKWLVVQVRDLLARAMKS